MHLRSLSILPLLAVGLLAAQVPPPPANPPYALPDAERAALVGDLTNLGKRISLLRAKADGHLLADVEVYYKAVAWMLRYPEEVYTRTYATNAAMLLKRGIERAAALEQGKHPWTAATGARIAFGYRSRVDASVQPFHLVIPKRYDPTRPARLDVVLHGRGATLTEISFLTQAETPKPPVVTYPDRLELHVFGRTNNAYRWAGETDVFEALAATEARFRIDAARIALRGFSMGGAGTWHIGLHHPHRWAAIEAGAGFTETRHYAKQTDPPGHHVKLWRIYDAQDVAANVFNVPTVGYGGEIDPQLLASVNIEKAIATDPMREHMRALFLVGPQTPHKFHSESKKQSDAFLDKHVAAGRAVGKAERVRFATYTTRYANAGWVNIEGLEQHYERAEVDADPATNTVRTKNVSRLSLHIPRGPDSGNGFIELDGTRLVTAPGTVNTFEKKTGGGWRKAEPEKPGTLRKRPGLQGPIDDALMDSFLVVKPNAPHAPMNRFLKEFAKWMRADPQTVDAAALTPQQIASHNLILFGDPSTNSVLRRVLPQLPLKWPPQAGRILAMIYPNPLNPSRYIVVNSGHTFGEKEFRGTNALLFPLLGDWAILDSATGQAIDTGFFDENWRKR
ncbi:MAG: hypothetical protein FJW31_10410 [Acidobacteria bacterium]|nr:hypothetical protein [Acidobacteriota bacterium]